MNFGRDALRSMCLTLFKKTVRARAVLRRVTFWSVTAALCSALLLVASPFLNLHNPLSYDPFNYLEIEELQWAYEPWITYNRLKAQREFANHPAVEASMQVYRNAVEADSAVTISMDAFLVKATDKSKAQCFDLVFTPEGQAGFTLSSALFEKRVLNHCEFYPERAKLSDDGRLLAVEVRRHHGAYFYAVHVFEVDGPGSPKLIHTIHDGQIVAPSSFLDAKTLLFQTGADKYTPSFSCAVSTWKNGVTGCFIQKEHLPKNQEVHQIVRAKGSDDVDVLLGPSGAYRFDVYRLRAQAPQRLEHTLASELVHFVQQESGFVYAREIDTAQLYQSQYQFFRYTNGKKAHDQILSVPSYRSSFVAFGREGYVQHVDSASGRNRIHHIHSHGVDELALSDQLANADEFRVAPSFDSKTPRVMWEQSNGDLNRGALSPEGTVAIDTKVKSGILLETLRFEAPSTDQAMVPCALVHRAGAMRPLPAIVISYGAYGVDAVSTRSPRAFAVMSNNITYLQVNARGGGKRGFQWTEDGRGAKNKRRTVEDTQACLDLAISKGLIRPGQVMMYGASAGAIPAFMTALSRPGVVSSAWGMVPYMDSSGRTENRKWDDHNFGNYSDPNEAKLRAAQSPYDKLLKPSNDSGVFLLTCGELDTVVQPWHCLKAHAAIRRFHPNRSSTLYVMPRTAHGNILTQLPSTMEDVELMVGFVIHTLRPELP